VPRRLSAFVILQIHPLKGIFLLGHQILQHSTNFPAPVTPISCTPYQLTTPGPTHQFFTILPTSPRRPPLSPWFAPPCEQPPLAGAALPPASSRGDRRGSSPAEAGGALPPLPYLWCVLSPSEARSIPSPTSTGCAPTYLILELLTTVSLHPYLSPSAPFSGAPHAPPRRQPLGWRLDGGSARVDL
jgi:hypothetical protein